MKLEFTSASSSDALFPAANTARLVNYYREPVMPGGRGQYVLRSVMGMEQISDLDRVFCRALVPFNGELMTISGGVLSRINLVSQEVTDVGTVGESEEAGIVENTGYACIVSDGVYRTWNGTTLATVAVDYPVASVSYIGGYTVLTELGGRRFAWSDLADPTTIDGLNFASAEINNDAILRGVVLKDILFLFKASGIELWGVTGQAGVNAFQRISGAMEETGLAGFGLVTTFPNGMAFVGSDGRVHIYAGGVKPISTPPVEIALTENVAETLFYYEQRGHGFICLTFRDAPAWCYDIATGEWHERDENGAGWSARQSVKIGGQWYVGTHLGRVSVLHERCLDNGNPLVRRAVSLPVAPGKPFSIARIAAFPRVGVFKQNDTDFVLDDGDSFLTDDDFRGLGWAASDDMAMIMLRTTRDGVVFGPEKTRDLGQIGQHGRQVTWRNLGQFRRMCAVEITQSSTMEVPILSALEVEVA